jgi:hypothetical protein
MMRLLLEVGSGERPLERRRSPLGVRRPPGYCRSGLLPIQETKVRRCGLRKVVSLTGREAELEAILAYATVRGH